MRKDIFRKSLFTTILMSLALFGCSNDNDNNSQQETKNPNTVTNDSAIDSAMQNYEKAYAELLSFSEYHIATNGLYDDDNIGPAYLINLNDDDIPELWVQKGLYTASIYSYDGTMVYHVGDADIGNYSCTIHYYPKHNVILFDYGSVMNDDSRRYYQTFVDDANRIKLDKLYVAKNAYDEQTNYCENIYKDATILSQDEVNELLQIENKTSLDGKEIVITNEMLDDWLNS